MAFYLDQYSRYSSYDALEGAISQSAALKEFKGLKKDDFYDQTLNPPKSCGEKQNQYKSSMWGAYPVWWPHDLAALRDRAVAKREREKQDKKDAKAAELNAAKQAKLDARQPWLPAQRRLEAAIAREAETRQAWEAALAEKLTAEAELAELQAARGTAVAAPKTGAGRKRKADTVSA